MMKTIDMRSLSREARYERRVQVIRLRDRGWTYDAIAAQVGLSRTGVFNICQRHSRGGPQALHDAANGRKTGDHRRLDAAQEAAICRFLLDMTPDRLKLPYALWTRGAVSQLIEDLYGIRLPVRTTGLYLKRWRLMPQKPMKKAKLAVEEVSTDCRQDKD
jgi:transposase